ncbi:head-tail connector protein [Streptomyces sp. V4-01]|uniref:Head-tail connector protein n=1 Tax=Actinacidiphila polyblastidii TaxID=3110430 RepID=A0ABU7PLR5_9ACTN|nr:head-tail connector protein [Streptomyces sp. V4-01]
MGALVYVTGQDVGLRTTALDATGAPATGTLAVSVAVTDPTGATTTPAAADGGGGLYTAVVPAVAAPGVWRYRWTATAAGVNWADEGQFQVRPPGIEQVVDLASVKAHLNINDSRQDDELQGFILAAGDLTRNVVGPILPETHTEWHNGGSRTLTLDWLPLGSVQSVTEYIAATSWPLTEQPLGTSTDAYGYTVDVDTGQITRRAVGDAVPFPYGIKNVCVVYTAGRGGVSPWAVRLGALELIRHLWQLTQQGGRPQFGGADLDSGAGAVPSGFALPNRVLELWKPAKREPGIA